jgi:dihydropteroate synthase
MMGQRIWRIGGKALDVGSAGLIMGVLNVTPDSFSDGGRFLDAPAAVEHGVEMARLGAAIIDIGGESSRPGADSISADEEMARVLPVIRKLRPAISAFISIDTRKAEVAKAALDEGADMVNDITAGADPEMLPLVAKRKAAIVLMHMKGEPKTMQDCPQYADVVGEVANFFRQRYACALDSGVDPMAIAFDPGIGFGKTLEHNLALLRNLEQLRAENRPIVVGVSRKSFLRKMIEGPGPDAGVIGTVALTALLRSRGADVFRVHEVAGNMQALRLTNAFGAS